MTSIDRTAYPGFSRAPQPKELVELYTPTPSDVAFVSTTARGPNQKFALMILLKVCAKARLLSSPPADPRGHHQPYPRGDGVSQRPGARYHAAYPLQISCCYSHTSAPINGDIKHIRHVALKAISEVVLVMDDPADLINVAIETLVKENCELPAFSTLDILVRRLRNLAHQRIFQTVLARLTTAEQALLERLVETNPTGYFTEFNRLRAAPKSATLTHLEDWITRLTWLQSLGNMARLLEGLAPAKITHFAAEARALHADDLRDFTLPKRLTLLVCLIHQETISTRDEIADMFLKRMSKLHDRAREELERLRASECKVTEHLVARAGRSAPGHNRSGGRCEDREPGT